MISGEELAFVRLAMRKRLVQANQVREAVERKKWDTPDHSLRSILVDMGVLKNDQVVALNDELRSGGNRRAKNARKPHTTMIGKDDHARENEEDLDRSTVPSVLGGYKLEKLLGAGAMGAVYLARHQELRRTVALKLLLTEGAPSPRAIQRFKREARLAARLDHPNVVRVYEAGQDKGYHYIAMDLVKGSSVAELITLGEMSPRRAVHVMRKTCEAVAYAHAQDVIHRDLKPANILVDEATGEARVTDFGLATLAEADEDDRLTRTGAAVGTPAYMAPEQVRGQLKEIDRRTDVYALGATLYEMLTSQPPFEAPTFLELAKKICDEPATSPRKRNRDVPVDVETICLKALEKAKPDRYETADDMAADLAAYLQDQEIVAQRPSAWVLAGRWLKRHPGLVTVMVAILTILVGSGAFYLSLPGYLEITTNPPGAEVLVDGKSVGTSGAEPIKVELSAGVHDLKFKLEGYQERALGIPTVTVGHGSTHQIAGSLVSSKGLLRVLTTPTDARVRVFKQGEEKVLVAGRTPFLESLPAGPYLLEVEKAGYQPLDRQTVEITPGGAESKIDQPLVPYEAEVVVTADPSDVSLDWSRDERAYAAPATFRGPGEHVIEGTKSGYLPRRLEVTLAADEQRPARLTLAPLLAFRRPLDGELVAGPLVHDVDADGAADLIVIVRGVGGNRLAVHPGRGRTRALFSARTAADTLVGVHDINADGTLDVVCGNQKRLEVRDGRQGKLIMSLSGLNAGSVGLSRGSRPPRLVYGGAASHPLTTGLSVTSLTVRVSRRPAFLRVNDQDIAAYAGAGSILLQRVVGGRKKARRVTVKGLSRVGWAARLYAVRIREGRSRWLVAVPPTGQALVIDPARGKSYPVGSATARYTGVQPIELAQGAWLFLSDAARQGRTTCFSLQEAFAKEEKTLSGLGMGVVVETGKRPRLWTASGTAVVYGKKGWAVDRSRSTPAEAWLPRDAHLTTADLTGDGRVEVIAPSADGRSLVVLDPSGRWLRWRVRAPVDGKLVPVRLSGGGPADVIVSGRRELVVLAGDDGRRRFQVALPGKVLEVAASPSLGGKPSDVYVLYEGDKGRALMRYALSDGSLKPAWPGPVKRPISGITCLPVDLDKDGANDILISAPLALLGSANGQERWTDDRDQSKTIGVKAKTIGPPRFVGTICVGPSFQKSAFEVVAHDQTGTKLWSSPFSRKVYRKGAFVPIPEPARFVLGAATASHCAVVTDYRLAFLKLGSGTPTRKRRDDQLKLDKADPILGGVMVGGNHPALVVVTRDVLRAYDPDAKGADPGILWEERLPAGSQRPSTPILIPQAKDRSVVALVTPTGVLAFYDPVDGLFLGERRYPEGGFRPGVTLLPTSEGGGALLLRTSDGRIVALELPRLDRPRPSLRMRVKGLARQLTRTPTKVAAMQELTALVQDSPEPFALLTLAEGHLAAGRPDDALSAIDQVLDRETSSLEALRLKALATYAGNQSLDRVRPVLLELKKIDRIRAAEVALELAENSRAEDEKQLYRAAVSFHPQDGRARRLLGLHMLRASFPIPGGKTPDKGFLAWRAASNSWWTARQPDELLEARRALSGVRLTLMQSLADDNHMEARAGAVLATALELAITKELRTKHKAKLSTKLLERTLSGLLNSGPPVGLGSPLYEKVRRVKGLTALSLRDRYEVLIAIHQQRRDWVMPLLGLLALGNG